IKMGTWNSGNETQNQTTDHQQNRIGNPQLSREQPQGRHSQQQADEDIDNVGHAPQHKVPSVIWKAAERKQRARMPLMARTFKRQVSRGIAHWIQMICQWPHPGISKSRVNSSCTPEPGRPPVLTVPSTEPGPVNRRRWGIHLILVTGYLLVVGL